MRLQLFSRISRSQCQVYKALNFPRHTPHAQRHFNASARALAVKPFLLADIGEGIRECEIIQWFVEPEAKVEEWDKLCEVQSDKASVEITSRFAGVIKKLHYDAGEMAQVGKPLIDIDIQGEIKQEDVAALTEESAAVEESKSAPTETLAPKVASAPSESTQPGSRIPLKPSGRHASLATPAVRHLTKELKVSIEDVTGTGKDGRVSKEDVHNFVRQRDSAPPAPAGSPQYSPRQTKDSVTQTETVTALTNHQLQMFKTMTKSLTIPHFLYADEIDFTGLSESRSKLNKRLAKSPVDEISKLSYLPFIIKAVSMALDQFPTLNARVDTDATTSKPVLVMRSQHNIGIAMDTPVGLLVPTIKDVQSLSVLSIAAELSRLQELAAAGKFSSQDLTGGTITVSNIGTIGGTYVSPVIVEKEVAILGIGKMRTIPAFGQDGQVVKKQICNFSWSADHRVVDGATMARAAEFVREYVENPDSMVLRLR